MNEKNLVICDREFRYANGLGENVSERKELAIKVYTCTKMESVSCFQKKKLIHILIIDERFTFDKRNQIEAEQVFVLTKDGCKDLQENEREIYKYQHADNILKEIFETYCEHTENDILRTVKKRKQRLLAVYSPIQRIGKTTFALTLGKEFAKKNKTLYVNMEEYPDINGRFMRAEGRNLGDLLYYMRQEKGKFALRLSNVLGQIEELDYILPILNSKDLKEITEEEWKELVELIVKESIYETIILDLGESVQGLFSILQMCDQIFMPILEDEVSILKMKRFEESLETLKMNNILQKTDRFVSTHDLEEYAREIAEEE